MIRHILEVAILMLRASDKPSDRPKDKEEIIIKTQTAASMLPALVSLIHDGSSLIYEATEVLRESTITKNVLPEIFWEVYPQLIRKFLYGRELNEEIHALTEIKQNKSDVYNSKSRKAAGKALAFIYKKFPNSAPSGPATGGGTSPNSAPRDAGGGGTLAIGASSFMQRGFTQRHLAGLAILPSGYALIRS
jgi:hypothetical protein